MRNIEAQKRKGRERKAAQIKIADRAFEALLEEFDAQRERESQPLTTR